MLIYIHRHDLRKQNKAFVVNIKKHDIVLYFNFMTCLVLQVSVINAITLTLL